MLDPSLPTGRYGWTCMFCKKFITGKETAPIEEHYRWKHPEMTPCKSCAVWFEDTDMAAHYKKKHPGESYDRA